MQTQKLSPPLPSSGSYCQIGTPRILKLASLLKIQGYGCGNGQGGEEEEQGHGERPCSIAAPGHRARFAWFEESRISGSQTLLKALPGGELPQVPQVPEVPEVPERLQRKKSQRRKYLVGSYLFNVMCEFPRKYTLKILGRDQKKTVYRMPLRLSVSRFAGAKFLKGYYNHLSRTALRKTAKLSSWKKGIEQHAHQTSLLSGFQPWKTTSTKPWNKGSLEPNPTSPKTYIAHKSRNEIGKKFLIALESRLDSSILRSLNSKPHHLTKQA